MSITVPRHHHALRHGLFSRYFLHPQKKPSLISAIGILTSGSSVLFDAHLFILQPGKQGTGGTSYMSVQPDPVGIA